MYLPRMNSGYASHSGHNPMSEGFVNLISTMHLPTRQFLLAPCYAVTDMKSIEPNRRAPSMKIAKRTHGTAKKSAFQLGLFGNFRPHSSLFITFRHFSNSQPPTTTPLGSSMV